MILPPPGSVVAVSRGVYEHQGILTEENTVIANSLSHGGVVEVPIGEFAEGQPLIVKDYPGRLDPDEVIRRARSRIGEPYDLFGNNCEHFVLGCHGQKPHSPQLRQFTALLVACVGVVSVLRARR